MKVKEAAQKWGLTPRRVQQMCVSGEIEGAQKKGKSWFIPDDINISESKKSLPIGISDFKRASREYYYIDKTLLIKDFLDEKPIVSLFTRPRRFGKTLNMDMLRTFFEKTDEDTSVYFKDKLIWQQGEKYREYQGKYPVIYFTFKDVKRDSWEETYQHITDIIRSEFERHIELLSSDKCSEYEKEYCRNILGGTASETDYMTSLKNLSLMLDKHFGIAPVIIIDEYDTPIQQGYSKDFYDKIILFMRNLFSGGFKDNKHLTFGFMTGILRVAKESIFSGLNNLVVYSVLDSKYSRYFGFTADEVKTMAKYYGAEDRFGQLCEWYDGYRFGNNEIFNPWSVINYFGHDCQPNAYWQSTGSNEVIGDILSEADADVYAKLTALMQGESVVAYIDTSVVYPQVKSNPSSLFSFLLVAGYLKAVHSETSFNGDYMCEISLPNKEITYVYRKEILRKLEPIIPQSSVISMQEAIYTGNAEELQRQMSNFLLQSVSCFDTAKENFYHGFVLGLCAAMEQYKKSSNRESGLGRYDIELIPKRKDLPGIIIEIKAAESAKTDLKELARTALKQIDEKRYSTELVGMGVNTVIKYGVAFCGKTVEVAAEVENK